VKIRAAGLKQSECEDGVAQEIEVYLAAGCCPRACGWFCPFRKALSSCWHFPVCSRKSIAQG
jgi:hypothetical protein